MFWTTVGNLFKPRDIQPLPQVQVDNSSDFSNNILLISIVVLVGLSLGYLIVKTSSKKK